MIDDEEEMATMVPLHANGKVENRGPPTKAQMQRQSQAAGMVKTVVTFLCRNTGCLHTYKDV